MLPKRSDDLHFIHEGLRQSDPALPAEDEEFVRKEAAGRDIFDFFDYAASTDAQVSLQNVRKVRFVNVDEVATLLD